MPKMKTHKGAAKRFKVTRKGKVLRTYAFHSHMLEKKSKDSKIDKTKHTGVSHADSRNVKKLIGAK